MDDATYYLRAYYPVAGYYVGYKGGLEDVCNQAVVDRSSGFPLKISQKPDEGFEPCTMAELREMVASQTPKRRYLVEVTEPSSDAGPKSMMVKARSEGEALGVMVRSVWGGQAGFYLGSGPGGGGRSGAIMTRLDGGGVDELKPLTNRVFWQAHEI